MKSYLKLNLKDKSDIKNPSSLKLDMMDMKEIVDDFLVKDSQSLIDVTQAMKSMSDPEQIKSGEIENEVWPIEEIKRAKH